MPDAYKLCLDCDGMYGPQDQRCKGLLKACENTFFRIRNRFASTGPPTGTVPPLASLVTKGVNDALGLLCCEEDNVTEGMLITDVVQVNYLARYEQLTHLPVYVNDLFRRCNLERIQLLNGKMLVAPGVTKLRSICMNLPSPYKWHVTARQQGAAGLSMT